jgi:predicted DNA binding CopG/RHH family protein
MSINQNVKTKIPEFKNYKEETEFWDTHDLTDFWDEAKPVEMKVARNLSTGITVKLRSQMVAELHNQAQKKGVGLSTLARMYILEKLQSQAQEHKSR